VEVFARGTGWTIRDLCISVVENRTAPADSWSESSRQTFDLSPNSPLSARHSRKCLTPYFNILVSTQVLWLF
jgi:hypothetical protein